MTESADPEDERDLGHRLLWEGRQSEAVEAFHRALSLTTEILDRTAISAELAWAIYEGGDTAEASRLATRTLETLASEPETPQSLLATGALSSVVGFATWLIDRPAAESRAGDAIVNLRRALETDLSIYERSVVLLELGRVHNLLEE